ncbi:hypothetical protein NL676_002862 [Syzygium grande]|nr:hypothetical protein NL676_002862 [Syzygium grande]
MFIQPLRFQHGGRITQQLVTLPNMKMDRLCGQFYSEAKEILALPMPVASIVMIGATLELTSKGDLVLKDADGTVAWFTNTSGKSALGLNLTDLGNLVLFDKNNGIVWQSFDEPTDSLVLGQKLTAGQRLMPSVSETNWTIDGMITLSVSGNGIFAQLETNPPQMYRGYFFGTPNISIKFPNISIKFPYVEFLNGSLTWSWNSTWNSSLIPVPQASSAQYMKLGSDGHLRVHEFDWELYGWKEVADLFTMGDCDYPTACGRYGICYSGQCSCPASSHFQQVDDRQPNLGCSENVPLSCGASQYQSLLKLEHVTYFIFTPDLENIDTSSCKEACAKNCSCKAAIFQYKLNPTNGSCYLLTQVFSLMNAGQKKFLYNSTTYLKVQNVANQTPNTSVDNRRTKRLPVILGSSLGALFAMMIFIVAIALFVHKRDDNQAEEDYLDQVPGMLNRFTYDDLKIITDEFSNKLGEGGFGSVFKGTLGDGTEVAIKRLDGFGQVKKSFLSGVETIGNIHHVNLRNDNLAMTLSIVSSAMEGIAWRGWLYMVFILHFVFACQFLLLQPLVSALDGQADAAEVLDRASQSIKVKRYNEALEDLNAAIEADQQNFLKLIFIEPPLFESIG